MKRALAAAAVAWAALATAAERALATWAPPAVWRQIAGANLGTALALALGLAWATRRRSWKHFAGFLLADAGLSRALLFDLADDPGEEHDLAEARPELAAAFRAQVEALRRGYEAVALEPGSAAPDAQTRELLEKLGYADSHESDEAAPQP